MRARSASPSDEVALAGFDNDAWTEPVSPGVTVIAQPVYEIGKNAMQLLPQRLADPSMSTRTLALPGELVTRGSTERSAVPVGGQFAASILKRRCRKAAPGVPRRRFLFSGTVCAACWPLLTWPHAPRR